MKAFKAGLLLLTALSANSAFADANLYFTGNIIMPTCTLDPDYQTQNISLDSAATTDFSSVGDTKKPKAFNLKLIDCAPDTKVTMTVSGTIDTVSSVLKNTSSGGATGVGIQLLQAAKVDDTTGTPIVMANAVSLGAVDSSKSMTIPMVAQYYRLSAMTGGSVSSSATVGFTYN